MRSIEVDEMPKQFKEVLDWLKETDQEVEILENGEVVARLIPVKEQVTTATVLKELDELGQLISKKWPEGVSAVDAVREVRREL